MKGRSALVGGVVVALASACFLRFARGPEAGARGAERESSARAAAGVRARGRFFR